MTMYVSMSSKQCSQLTNIRNMMVYRSLDSVGAGGRLWSAHSTHSTPRCRVNF